VEGKTYSDEALRIAERGDHTITLLHAYFGVGFLFLRQGEIPKAIPALEHGLEICQSRQVLAPFARFASALGAAYILSGRLTEALPLLEQAVKQSISRRYLQDSALWLTHLGEAYMLAGRIEEALQCAGRALEYAQARQERGHEAWTLRLLGDIAAHQAPPESETAEAHYRQALVLAEELGMRPLQPHCHLGLGTLYARTGQRQQAGAALSTAIEMYRAMDMTFWLPQAEVALAQVEEQ
jgi:tetratricopeptide (TPR) repeat protein